MKHKVVRVDNLMYDGCEPHWKCTRCGKCVPFHCYTKEQFENQECNSNKVDCKMSIRSDVREQLKGVILFDKPSFDNSIIGVTTDGAAVYSYEKMVAELMGKASMNMYEAKLYINDNIISDINSRFITPPVIMYEKTWPTKYHS